MSCCGAWSYEDVDLALLTVPILLAKAEADAAMRVVLEDYSHDATSRNPAPAKTPPGRVLRPCLGRGLGINLAERVRDVGVRVVVAAQSVEGPRGSPPGPRLLASCAGGVVVQQCPDPCPRRPGGRGRPCGPYPDGAADEAAWGNRRPGVSVSPGHPHSRHHDRHQDGDHDHDPDPLRP
jgi:hypothetical protein